MIDADRFWESDEAPVAPGVSEERIEAWEARHQVSLPLTLRSALRRRDGGPVRNTEITVFPLREIQPVDEEDLRFDEDVDRDPALVFRFGEGMESDGEYLMDYNSVGPGESPSVYIHYNDGTGATLLGDSLDAYLERRASGSPGSDVDWSDAERAQDVLARESVDLTAFHGAQAHLEQVLVRQGDAVVLYTREATPDGETLAKTTLPLPFHAALVMTFGLHLQPENHEGVVRLESRRRGDGSWINTAIQGAPVYVRFESADRDRLEAVRGRVLGGRSGEGESAGPPTSARSADDGALDLLRRVMELKMERDGERNSGQ